MKNWMLIIFLLAALAGCNNSGAGNTEETNDTTNPMNNTITNPQNDINSPAGADTLGRDTLRDHR